MAYRSNILYAGLLSAGLAFGTLIAGTPAAQATVISGASSAYGESVSLTLTPLLGPVVNITSGPLPTVSGSAPPPYSNSNSVLSVSVGGILTTGVLTVNANSNVNGLPGARSTSADATVDDLSLSILSVLGVNLASIQSTADVSGDFGALLATGTTTIVGLSINGGIAVNLTPAPNTVLLSALGITITANEQTTSGDGISNAGIDVNALHINFTNVPAVIGLTAGLLNGDIVISHSEATASAQRDTAVPEPGSLLLLAGGIVLAWGLSRRRPA